MNTLFLFLANVLDINLIHVLRFSSRMLPKTNTVEPRYKEVEYNKTLL